jgi:hypothetical protein
MAEGGEPAKGRDSGISVANMQLKLVDPMIDIGNALCVENPS